MTREQPMAIPEDFAEERMRDCIVKHFESLEEMDIGLEKLLSCTQNHMKMMGNSMIYL